MVSNNFTRLRRQALDQLQRVDLSAQRAWLVDLISGAASRLKDPSARSFLLPANGRMLDPNTQMSIKLDKLRMPFPQCVLEYQIEKSFYKSGEDYSSALDRGRLNPDAAVLIVVSDEMSVRCFPVWRMVYRGVPFWQPSRGAFLIAANNAIEIDRRGFATGDFSIIKPLALDEHLKQPANEFVDELVVLAQFCMLCSCDNVAPVKIFEPSSQLVKRCHERRKLPPDEYYVLDCFMGEHAERGPDGIGGHASPRFHVRRGHVRRLPDGRTTWVRQCTVGDAALGKIEKDYRIRVRA